MKRFRRFTLIALLRLRKRIELLPVLRDREVMISAEVLQNQTNNHWLNVQCPDLTPLGPGFSIICITLDDFGSLATDLSLLLKIQPNEKYPFVTNLYDFETLLWGFGKEKKNEIDFLKYLDKRERLHGRVYTFDELEIADHFLKYGSFCKFDEADRISFDITNALIFDKHYFAEHGVKYPIENNDKNGPYYIEIKRQGNKIVTGIKGFPDTYEEINLANNSNKTNNIIEKDNKDSGKIGRNDPCPCGSGKKYKKCCGKNKFGLS
jgi:hypothetical protein